MTHVLTIDSGNTYLVDSTETRLRVELNGTLDLDSTLKLNDTAQHGDEIRPPGPPTGIDLPMAIDLDDMDVGNAVFLIGTLGSLFGMSWLFRNPAAAIVIGLAFIAMVFAGLFSMGLEIFWMLVVGAIVLLIVGFVVRWMA